MGRYFPSGTTPSPRIWEAIFARTLRADPKSLQENLPLSSSLTLPLYALLQSRRAVQYRPNAILQLEQSESVLMSSVLNVEPFAGTVLHPGREKLRQTSTAEEVFLLPAFGIGALACSVSDILRFNASRPLFAGRRVDLTYLGR
jgi:hypothetical protein